MIWLRQLLGHWIRQLLHPQVGIRTRLGPGCWISSCSACAYINYESIFDFWPYYIPDILGKWKYYELLEEWDTSDEFAFWRKYFILCQIIYQKFQKSENILSYKISENIFFICPLNNLIFQIWENILFLIKIYTRKFKKVKIFWIIIIFFKFQKIFFLL